MAGNLITSVLSLATNLLPSIRASVQAPSSSSSNSNNSERGRAQAFKEDLERLMRTLERIKATLYDAEERKIRDRSVKLWLKELKKVAYDAQDVLDEYQYEVTRVQLEARKASEASGSHKRKKMEIMADALSFEWSSDASEYSEEEECFDSDDNADEEEECFDSDDNADEEEECFDSDDNVDEEIEVEL